MNITSAAGVLSLLKEPEPEVKYFALKKLDNIVHVFWAEISDFLSKIEMLYEDEFFHHRKEAALLASKVYYHLGAFEESLTYALGAGDLFDVNDKSEYVDTIISKCIDFYTKQRVANAETDAHHEIDTRLEAVVNRMFQRCFDDRQFKQAVGIALETRRIDVFKKAIQQSDDIHLMLNYSFKVCMSMVQNLHFRNTLLNELVRLYMRLPTPDYINACQCYIFLNDPQNVANILEGLLKGNEDSLLMAYQIGFDLYESATQQFLQKVQSALREVAPIPIPEPSIQSVSTEKDSSTDQSDTTADASSTVPSTESSASAAIDKLSDQDRAIQDRITKLNTILGGSTTIGLHLQFLIRNNKADMLILKNTKDAVRNSVCHTATVIANAYMNSGTTCDQFLRDNLDWLSRATNWAKFTATASLGVIHKGHESQALHLMSTYLPKDSGPGSAFSEGGGLYALGMIHANHGGEMTEYLLRQLKDATTDMVRHGACLGLGLAAMGTARQDIYEQLKFNLYQDDAVTGEAAGIAMGLVMLGTKSPVLIEDMINYAKETQHEKILRGLAVGIAMTMYGRLEEADALIQSLMQDKDPILRWSGMYTLAMAYAGSSNNHAIRKLLHVAVSDVNDDVRRVAVTSLGFLLFRNPEQCPSVVSLLSQSYNPHVRYGAAVALGIACAGTGLKDALALLEPMLDDPVTYVRQGALIASALILIQQNEVTCPKMTTFRQTYSKVIADKHDDVMAKFGAILAQGIIDAGGRNVTISLQSRTGHTNMGAVVGMLVFCQFWFWYPLAHFLNMAFTPTSVIGLNADLKMPKIELRSAAKPSTYAYVAPLEEKKDKNKEKVETAILSITAKRKKKEAEKMKGSGASSSSSAGGTESTTTSTSNSVSNDNKEEKMEVEEEKKDPCKDDVEEKMEEDKDQEEGEEKPEKKVEKKVEPNFEMLPNPARVMRSQLKVIQLDNDLRYSSLKDVSMGGIIMLKNKKPEEEEEIVENVAAGGPQQEDDEDEPAPPEPFEWTED